MNPRILAIVSTLLLLAACRQAPTPAEDQAGAAQPGAPAVAVQEEDAPDAAEEEPARPDLPTLEVATIDGGRYDLAEHRGEWVVVNFWATWCSPCLKEMPELSALDAMHEHVGVVGLAYEDIEPEAMRDFLAKHPVVYPIAIIDTYDPPSDFDTPRGLPMTYLIGPDGRVVKRFLGPVHAREIEAAIADAGGPAIPAGPEEAGS